MDWPQVTLNARFYDRFLVAFICEDILLSPVLFHNLYQPPSYVGFQLSPARASVGDSVINMGLREGRYWAPIAGPHNHRSVELRKAM